MGAKALLPALMLGLLAAGVANVLAADGRPDVSQIIDKAAAESILEESVSSPAPRNVDGTDGYYSKCNYYSTSGKKRLVLRIYHAASGSDPQKELETVAENTGAMRAISGLGDKARMSSGVEGGLPSQVVMLYVVKGNYLVTVGVSGFDDANAAAEKVKDVAQKIVAKL